VLDLIGGRGRNRTYNLSVKSRMLCQLSYASSNFKQPHCSDPLVQLGQAGLSCCHLKNIAQTGSISKGARDSSSALRSGVQR
jgi:hypothetical protein